MALSKEKRLAIDLWGVCYDSPMCSNGGIDFDVAARKLLERYHMTRKDNADAIRP